MESQEEAAQEALIPNHVFFKRRFARLKRDDFIGLIEGSGQWKYGPTVLRTRNQDQLFSIWIKIWFADLPKRPQGVSA